MIPVTVAADWWAFVARGLLAIGLGVLALAQPEMALLTLVYLFGGLALLEGGLLVGAAAFHDVNQEVWPLLLGGLLSATVGTLAFVVPGITALVLTWVVAGWALLSGVTAIAAAIGLRRVIAGEALLALSGVLSIGLALFLVVFPGIGALTLVVALGVWALVSGVVLVALGARLWRLAHPADGEVAPAR